MKKVFVLIALMLSISLAGCSTSANTENEIRVQIQLDLQEDIGLLLVNYHVDGAEGKGGMSNSDRSMLKKDSGDLVWTYDKELLDEPSDSVDVTLQFVVVTEYFDPNYDNDYPEEYMIPMDAISFEAAFGESCYVTISGDKVNGYRAELSGA